MDIKISLYVRTSNVTYAPKWLQKDTNAQQSEYGIASILNKEAGTLKIVLLGTQYLYFWYQISKLRNLWGLLAVICYMFYCNFLFKLCKSDNWLRMDVLELEFVNWINGGPKACALCILFPS